MVELPGSYPFAGQQLRAVLFCDFDGTLTPEDIGLELFRRYSRGEVLEERLRRGEISVLEYYQQACQHLDPDITAEQIAEFAHRIGLRPSVEALFRFCSQHGIGVAILSDGLDVYIEPLLAAAGLEMIPVACNRLRWVCGTPQVDFPWASESCQYTCPSPYPCAACKRAALLSWTPPQVPVLFLGEGLSDFCPAFYADIVFARAALAAWCREHQLGFIPYEELSDVCQALEQLLQRQRLSLRYLPRQRRQRAWVEE
jgi:HAD superfamily phosphoserine phosphatase-like hydrolase